MCIDEDHKDDLILILSVTCVALVVIAFLMCLGCCWMMRYRKRNTETAPLKDELLAPLNPSPPFIPPPMHHAAHYSRFHTLMCGDEWVFFNAAQVLPCYVIKVHYKSKSTGWQPVNPPPLATNLLQKQTDKDEDVPKVERDRRKKAKLLARVSIYI